MPCRGCSSVYPLNILGGGGREEQNLGYSISMAICAGWWPLRVKLRFARGISWPKNSLRDISSGFETRVRIISFDVFRERFVDRYRFRLGPYNLLSIRTAYCFQLETHSYYNIAGVCQTRVGNTGRFKHFERYREISLPICARSWWVLTL